MSAAIFDSRVLGAEAPRARSPRSRRACSAIPRASTTRITAPRCARSVFAPLARNVRKAGERRRRAPTRWRRRCERAVSSQCSRTRSARRLRSRRHRLARAHAASHPRASAGAWARQRGATSRSCSGHRAQEWIRNVRLFVRPAYSTALGSSSPRAPQRRVCRDGLPAADVSRRRAASVRTARARRSSRAFRAICTEIRFGLSHALRRPTGMGSRWLKACHQESCRHAPFEVLAPDTGAGRGARAPKKGWSGSRRSASPCANACCGSHLSALGSPRAHS
jgi:hypothetical protein